MTGDVRGAGTNATVKFDIHGTAGDLGPTVLNPKLGFERDTPETFEIESPQDLGDIQEVTIGHDEAGLGAGWYVDHLELTIKSTASPTTTTTTTTTNTTNTSTTTTNRTQTFIIPIQRWLGHSDSGGISGAPYIRLPLRPCETTIQKSGYKRAPFLKLSSSACALPTPKKVSQGMKAVVKKEFGFAGEDAYAIGGRAIAVADGVYSWREKGVDAGLYSQFLTQTVIKHHLSHPHKSPQTLMELAFAAAKQKGVQGSCTLVVCRLDALRSVLHAAVLGDSGFLVVRGLAQGQGRIVYRSPHQEHFFGYPYQLGHHDNSDQPSDAIVVNTPVEEGDVIAVATDGLFDNLTDEEIVKLLEENYKSTRCECFAASQALVKAAFNVSQDENAQTPYSMAATEEFHMIYSGGKSDDITVVVAEVRAFFED